MNTIRRRATSVSVASLAAASAFAIVLGAASSAAASYNPREDENAYSAEACKGIHSTSFKFSFNYNSGFVGAYRNLGYAHGDFDNTDNGGGTPLLFCDVPSLSLNGEGSHIKNAAAAAANRHTSYNGVVYFNSYWKGPSDTISTNSQRNLANTYNEDASFQWK